MDQSRCGGAQVKGSGRPGTGALMVQVMWQHFLLVCRVLASACVCHYHEGTLKYTKMHIFSPNKADLHGYSNAHACLCKIGAVEPVKFYFPYLQLLPKQIYLFLHFKHYCRCLTGLKEDFLLKTLQPGMNQSGGMSWQVTMCCVPEWRNSFRCLCCSPTFSPWMTGQSPEPRPALHLWLRQKREEDWKFSPKARVTHHALAGPYLKARCCIQRPPLPACSRSADCWAPDPGRCWWCCLWGCRASGCH